MATNAAFYPLLKKNQPKVTGIIKQKWKMED
jgi:hypothetical protein